MLFSLFTSLPAAFCGKLSSWRAAGEGCAGPSSAVRKRLRSSQREQARLARAGGHRCCSERGFVQHPRAVRAPAAAVPRTPPPPAVPSPAQRSQGATRTGRNPPAPAQQPLPWDGASSPSRNRVSSRLVFIPSLIYSFAPVTGYVSWRQWHCTASWECCLSCEVGTQGDTVPRQLHSHPACTALCGRVALTAARECWLWLSVLLPYPFLRGYTPAGLLAGSSDEMQAGALVQGSFQGRELARAEWGTCWKRLRNWGSCPSVPVCSPGTLFLMSHVSPAMLNQLNPVTEGSPSCSAVCFTCVVFFPINSVISGHVTAVQCLNTVFFTFTAMIFFFIAFFLSIFGKEVILTKQYDHILQRGYFCLFPIHVSFGIFGNRHF